MVYGAVRLSIILALVAFYSAHSNAKPESENAVVAEATSEVSLAIQPEQEPFLLSDWYQDSGSGGFPENFSDERRLVVEWDNTPVE